MLARKEGALLRDENGVEPRLVNSKEEHSSLWRFRLAAAGALSGLALSAVSSCGNNAEEPAEPLPSASQPSIETPIPTEATGTILDSSVKPFEPVKTSLIEQDAETRQKVLQRLDSMSVLTPSSLTKFTAHAAENIDTLKKYYPDKSQTIDNYGRWQDFDYLSPGDAASIYNQQAVESQLYGNKQNWPKVKFAEKYIGKRPAFSKQSLEQAIAGGSAVELARLIESTQPNRGAVWDLGLNMAEAGLSDNDDARKNLLTLVRQGTAPGSEIQSSYVKDMEGQLSFWPSLAEGGSLDPYRVSPELKDDKLTNAFVYAVSWTAFANSAPKEFFDEQDNPTTPGAPVISLLVTRNYTSVEYGENGQRDPNDTPIEGNRTYLATYIIVGLGNNSLTTVQISREPLGQYGFFKDYGAWDLIADDHNREPDVRWQ